MRSSKDIARTFLDSRNALFRTDLKKRSGQSITRKYTDMADEFVKSLYSKATSGLKPVEVKEGRLAVAAVGSYGRRELCPGSDIDLLVIHRGSLSTETGELISQILYPLWDAKLEVGHTVLTVQESMQLVWNDFRFLTSAMDSRFLMGSRHFFKDFQEIFWTGIGREKRKLLAQFLLNQEKRKEKYAGQGYFVEPDIKEGLGGLRDLHFMAWMARIFFNIERFSQISRCVAFSHFDINSLNRCRNFLLKVRNHLHLLAGRKEDRLLLSYQKTLSQRLDYKGSPHISGAGRFMRQYYFHMNRIRYSQEEFRTKTLDTLDPKPLRTTSGQLPPEFQELMGNIVLNRGYLLQDNPLLILRAFIEANRRGLFLGSGFIWEAKRRIKVEANDLSALKGAKEAFLDFVLNPKTPKIFRLALEIGLIDLFIPEFRRIRNLAQFSYYHQETVDLHSLKTMEVITRISMGNYDDRWPVLKEVFKELKHPDRLTLAGLLHDIGKGYRGDHSRRGATLIPRILHRFGLSERAIEMVSFLIEHHLLLADISQKRDLNEEKTSVQVAQTLKTSENLKMLLLLTVSDSMATGTMANSDWKIRLLIELFFKVRNILDKGTLASPDARKRLESIKRRLNRRLKTRFPRHEIMALMDQVPMRYFLSTPFEDIILHFGMALTLREKNFSWVLEKVEKIPVTKIILCTHDRPGLFSKMVGVFTLNNIKVLTANIFTLKNGLAFDFYEVTNPLDPLREAEMWEKVKKEAILAIEERMPLGQMIDRRDQRAFSLNKDYMNRRAEVALDNEASDFFTIIEVKGGSKFGLLYALAKEIHTLDMDIRFARVNRNEEEMSGVFYVSDASGQKLSGASLIEKTKARILTVLQ